MSIDIIDILSPYTKGARFSARNRGKRRIYIPKKSTKYLHNLFREFLRAEVNALPKKIKHNTTRIGGSKPSWDEANGIAELPSATAFKKGCNPIKNILSHRGNEYFFVTDIKSAYQSVNIDLLSALIVWIMYYDEMDIVVTPNMFSVFPVTCNHRKYDDVRIWMYKFFSKEGGLVIGGPASPYLFNLYMEVFADESLRSISRKERIIYTRYADDLVFSGKQKISKHFRSRVRSILQGCSIYNNSLHVNHKKSKVVNLYKGPVTITGLKLRKDLGEIKLVFPQKKRKKLHGLINSFINRGTVGKGRVAGYVAEFLGFYNVVKSLKQVTKSDEKTLALCREFRRSSKSTGV